MKIGPSEVPGFTVFLQRDVRAQLVPEALIDLQQLIAGGARNAVQSVQSSPVLHLPFLSFSGYFHRLFD